MNPVVHFVVFAVAGMALTFVALVIALSMSDRLPLDRPNERSLHSRPIPRVGGAAIVPGIILGAAGGLFAGAWRGELQLFLALALAFALACVSLADDVRRLPVGMRLLAHFSAAGAWLAAVPQLSALSLVAALIAVVWMTNLYNFMDGADGLAGGMTIFGFCAYAFAAWQGNDISLAGVCLSVALPATAFLGFNFHPARVFMGDVGSIPLGFLAACLGIAGWLRTDWAGWFPALVFSPFICDATVTLLRRVLRGEKFWNAHREHFYQQLVQLGVGHRNTALAEYLLMLACAVVAVSFRQAPWREAGVLWLFVAMFYAALMIAINRRARMRGASA